MEDSWFLSMPVALNAKMLTSRKRETKNILREVSIAINEMTNVLEHFWNKAEQKKEDSSNRLKY